MAEVTGDDGLDEPVIDHAAHAPERPIDRFHRSAAGTVIAAGMFGLRDALEGRPEREEAAIMSEAPTRPEDGFALVFYEDDPASLTVVVPRTPKSPTPKSPTPKSPTPKSPTPKSPTPKSPTPKSKDGS